MWAISVFIKLKSIDSVKSFQLAAGDVLHINTLSILSTERDFFQISSPAFFLSAFLFIYIFHECFGFVKSQGHRVGKKNYMALHCSTQEERSQGYLWCQVFKREWKLDNGNYRPLLHKPWPVYVWGWEQDICLSDGKLYWRIFIHMFISLLLLQSLNIFLLNQNYSYVDCKIQFNAMNYVRIVAWTICTQAHSASVWWMRLIVESGGYYELWYEEIQLQSLFNSVIFNQSTNNNRLQWIYDSDKVQYLRRSSIRRKMCKETKRSAIRRSLTVLHIL